MIQKVKVRGSAVRKALLALMIEPERFAEPQALEARVYVDYRLTPESFPKGIEEGAVILHFLRHHPKGDWQLDETQFLVLTKK